MRPTSYPRRALPVWIPIPTRSPGSNAHRVHGLERFVDDDRVAEGAGRGRGEDIEPARRDDADPVRQVVGVDQVDSHSISSGQGKIGSGSRGATAQEIPTSR